MANFLAKLPGIGGFFDDSGDQINDLMRQSRALYENIPLPELQDYRPEDLQYLGDYRPEAAGYQTIGEDPRLRSAQLSALSKLAGLGETGLSAVDELGYQQARDLASQAARSSQAAALQNAQARGVGGSGLEYALREAGSQEGATRAQQAGLQQASDSARMRALYNQAYGDMLGSVRGQDANIAGRNADIINQFNQLNTGARNQAQQYNLGNRQNISNQNVQQRNQAQLTNNDIKNQRFNNAMQKAGGIFGANQGVARGIAGQSAADAGVRGELTKLGGMIAGGVAGGAPAAKATTGMTSSNDWYDWAKK